MREKSLHAVLIGNANVGKSTIFNLLANSNQKASNWSGVTVTSCTKVICHNNQDLQITDLPGIDDLTYNSEFSKDQSITKNYLQKNRVDLIINVVDSNYLEKNFYLTLQLLELGIPMIVVLNKSDIASKKITINQAALAKYLQCPVISTSHFLQPTQISTLKDLILQPKQPFKTNLVRYSKAIEQKIQASNISNRFHAVEAVITKHPDSDFDVNIASSRYKSSGFMAKKFTKIYHKKQVKTVLDSLFLNKYLGLPLFFLIIYSVLMLAVSTSNIFTGFVDIMSAYFFVDYPLYQLNSLGVPANTTSVLTNGIGRGLQTVVTFIPVIFFLFFYLAILESSGYLSRAEFLIDKIMRSLGLPGKAFIPMVLGFGCSVPAIMATRRLSGANERVVVGMMSPFMSCGARLPTYTIFATAFFYDKAIYMVMLLYLVGVLAAVVTGLLLKSIITLDVKTDPIIEFADYQLPSLSGIVSSSFKKTKVFAKESSLVIVLVSTALSFLALFSVNANGADQPLLAVIAQFISPIFAPFGIQADNWQAAISIVTGLFAKEVIVGSLNGLYSSLLDLSTYTAAPVFLEYLTSACKSLYASLPFTQALVAPTDFSITNLQNNFQSSVVAFAYLLFILLYTPCVTAVIALKKEFGWQWAVFSSIWSLFLAYVASISFYLVFSANYHLVYCFLWFFALALLWVVFYHCLKKNKVKNTRISILEIG